MRLGFILGFLVGALVASVKGETNVAEAPGVTSTAEAIDDEAEPASVVEKFKRQLRIAADAGREEAARREAELTREFEAAKNSPAS